MERVARIKPFANSTQMNILMFALDSMSHMSYQRMLPKTYAYLKHTLQAITLDAYNIVGDATTAAIIPIFTGQTEIELPETRVNKEGSHYVDIYPFIWNKFEQSGYVTLYAEDQPSLGTFQLRLNGFEEPPVDHYMRPFWQAALSSEIHEASLQYCLGGKPEHQYTLDYMKDLFVKYPTVPKFAFGFIGELSHADNNPAQYIDNDLKEFLEYLRVNGHLENTLLIVMGDHGARYSAVRQTTQGKLEERLPMMSFTFPEKFKMKYPHLITNLMRNKEQLSTPFDIHETLKTVLDIYNAEKPIRYSDRGISLLNSIPSNRTCASAGIALHWCTCMQYEYLDVEEKKVKDIAEHVVSQLNDKLHPLTIETSPNNGLYEATIQAVVIEHSLSIVGDISRINRYGDQPHCILEKHPDLRKYCLCMKEPTPTPRRGYRKMKTSKKN
ncbi:hypothetical protein LSH36_926g00042 [Paralvinella palmiformis]|uniref:Uncharacterized protein n=1 Tax=Paralvinella palmiformis TaxID=53620 RepID=A0AAD9MRD1_9ANNE|nr:hypothetical protein LSH36_926g00042 [Paralvinella palmiformis]